MNIPNNAEVWFESVAYYDSDMQGGYSAFLREPLRLAANVDSADSSGALDIARALPVGGTLRSVIGVNERP